MRREREVRRAQGRRVVRERRRREPHHIAVGVAVAVAARLRHARAEARGASRRLVLVYQRHDAHLMRERSRQLRLTGAQLLVLQTAEVLPLACQRGTRHDSYDYSTVQYMSSVVYTTHTLRVQ